MSSKIRNAARGQPCQIMLPGICISGGDNETTVLAHMPNQSMGKKAPDLVGAHSCHACHDVLDSRVSHSFDRDFLRHKFLEGMKRTIIKLHEDGVLNMK